jgi:EAL domain-containing protein (putative c-di-GMP-specific phosphodiesterase class I)
MSVALSTYATVEAVIDARAVTTVFQPIVRLDAKEREIVGMEAFSRGPKGSPWETPLALFTAARETGRGAELDWICRARAYRTAINGGLPDGIALFVNTAPEAVTEPCPPDLLDTIRAAQLRLRVCTDLPARGLDDPAGLLRAAAACRRIGWGVALDDVGADPAALALLWLVRPDVVKVDRPLPTDPEQDDSAHLTTAVTAYAERTGAAVVAEGIETEAQLATARSLGATLGQGWHFGRPGPVAKHGRLHRPGQGIPAVAVPETPAGTPYDVVTRVHPPAEATKRVLLGTSHLLEARAVDAAEPPVLLATFQHAATFTAATKERYARYAKSAAMVVAFGTDLPPRPADGVHGVTISGAEPLRSEWTVIAVGPHFTGALVARDLGDTGPDLDRRFSYVVTHERDLVLAAARVLLNRL